MVQMRLGLSAPFARLIPELSHYTVVSIVALGMDLAVFNAVLFSSMRASLAGIIGYTAGLGVHYVLSRRFVFTAADTAKGDLRRFGEFALTGCVGLAMTWGVIALATDVAHLPAMFGKIVAVGTSFVVVFLLRRGIVFAGRKVA